MIVVIRGRKRTCTKFPLSLYMQHIRACIPFTKMNIVSLCYGVLAAVEAAAWVDPAYMPMNAHMLIAASCVVLIGCHASLNAEPEAAETEEGSAWGIPVSAVGSLATLFIAFKYLDANAINLVLRIYFVLMGVFSVGDVIRTFLPARMRAEEKHFIVDFVIPKLGHIQLSKVDLFVYSAGLLVSGAYAVRQHWLLNNVLGFSFTITALSKMLIGNCSRAMMAMIMLFVYDITMVYGTPMMIEVATKVDGPIKLLFPRGFLDAHGNPATALLGLGDLVVPGLFLSLVLRFEAFKHLKANASAKLSTAELPYIDFPRPIFMSVWVAYALGLVITVVVMIVWESGQPALFFLVPSTLLAAIVASVITGNSRKLMEHSDDDYLQAIHPPIKQD
jgi:minor histocompatibility antigen H13